MRGSSWAIGKNKADFVGKRSLQRPSMLAATRKQLVGLRTKDAAHRARGRSAGGGTSGQRPPMELIGHVTSSYCEQRAGLFDCARLVAGGRARLGQTLYRAHAERRYSRSK